MYITYIEVHRNTISGSSNEDKKEQAKDRYTQIKAKYLNKSNKITTHLSPDAKQYTARTKFMVSHKNDSKFQRTSLLVGFE